MADLHLMRIENRLLDNYASLKRNLLNENPNTDELSIKSRLLAGHALCVIGNTPIEDLPKYVVDGAYDRGIDAVYYDEVNHRLTFVQAKWRSDGKGEPIGEADAGTFAHGIGEALRDDFPQDTTNSKLLDLREMLKLAAVDMDLRVEIVIISTAEREISDNAKNRIREGLRATLDDDYELTVLNQKNVYKTFSNAETGRGTNFDLILHDYGMVSDPYQGIYGWITGYDLAQLISDKGPAIYSRNIRSALGSTIVNEDIAQTARENPESFWYFNNGLTFVADDLKMPRLNNGYNFKKVSVENGSIVNGAQTSSTLAEVLKKADHSDNPENQRIVDALKKVHVQVRIISVKNASEDEEFPRLVTRYTNSQNGVGAREFVSLDSFQDGLKRQIDEQFGRAYLVRSGIREDITETTDFDLQTATLAMVCARQATTNVVKAKSGISALWKDTTKAPYTDIFDRDTTSALALVKAVDLFRMIDTFLAETEQKSEEVIDKNNNQRALRFTQVARHGNRIFQHLIMKDQDIFNDKVCLEAAKKEWKKIDLETKFRHYAERIYDKYPDAYLAYLFKNQQKCLDLIENL
ncbi:AIPR family protein [Trueperella pyogenes]|uniref:AIPR family protein n=1 Tax=Trueperella pyogenes TaxID=1661 RepID=UPI00345DD7E3